MRQTITTAGAALLLLSCSGGADKDGNGAAVAANGAAQANAAMPAAPSGGSAPAAVAELRPGQWETTIEVLRMDMPNMPQGVTIPTQRPVTARTCLTPEQARRPNAGFMTGKDGAGCSYENFSMSGGRLQGAVTCNQAGTSVRVTMNGTFSAESYQIESETQAQAGGTNVNTVSRITARRIGDCPG